ncbi:MAG: hypothetical protein JWR89_2024 [Tardiphaga sp.]|uniref:hypothetical protein n=1 Tax=Tardiphaga sp. TaxID=1926292 RepID=UPI002613E80F|nr:hypothetical protein [Tardiphaga sp.]MDB5502122.1 hypothetical protein [Tardiphaga sp.]
MKSTLVAAAALLVTASMAMAQAPAPDAAPEAAPTAPAAPAAKAARKPVVRAAPAAPATPKLPGATEITQIVGIRQIDPTTYEIDAKAQGGAPVNLRMNVFVMQDLGRQLGTYGK